MQSGISASKELQDTFREFLGDRTTRGLLVTISTAPEQLVTKTKIASTSADFSTDLSNVERLLEDNVAAYILLRQHSEQQTTASGALVAVTYVPDRAPVKQKMLFASTRLTLVRELGTEHFGSTLYATDKDELTAAGWARHEAHEALAAPLTREEQDLAGIREAEAQESRSTGGKRGGHLATSSGFQIKMDDAALAALQALAAPDAAESIAVVQLQIDIPTETLQLASSHPGPVAAAQIAGLISESSPRYTYYSARTGPAPAQVVFMYTCPTGSSIKERMLYASMRRYAAVLVPEKAGLAAPSAMEASSPAELTADAIEATLRSAAAAAAAASTAAADAEGGGENGQGDARAGPGPEGLGAQKLGGQSERAFARPKRPGARR